MTEKVQEIIEHCVDIAKISLEQTTGIDPFAAFVGSNERIHPKEFEFDRKSVPTKGEVIDFFENELSKELKEKTILGYAITYEVKVQLSKEETIDAFAIDIQLNSEDNPLFYFPYEINESKEVSYREMFAVKR